MEIMLSKSTVVRHSVHVLIRVVRATDDKYAIWKMTTIAVLLTTMAILHALAIIPSKLKDGLS